MHCISPASRSIPGRVAVCPPAWRPRCALHGHATARLARQAHCSRSVVACRGPATAPGGVRRACGVHAACTRHARGARTVSSTCSGECMRLQRVRTEQLLRLWGCGALDLRSRGARGAEQAELESELECSTSTSTCDWLLLYSRYLLYQLLATHCAPSRSRRVAYYTIRTLLYYTILTLLYLPVRSRREAWRCAHAAWCRPRPERRAWG